jgi:acyl-coenzyme A synthetase/AMP-(fatty) acid ligase
MKCGAMFVPIGPEIPPNRIREILDATNASLVVTSDQLEEKLRPLAPKTIVLSASSVEGVKASALQNFDSVKTVPEDPMFVLFTSGSTGKPKGIIHKHGAISTHGLSWINTGLVGKRVFQFSSWIFDVSIIDMVTTLISGGCLCIPHENNRTVTWLE